MGTAIVFTASLEVQLLIFPGDFKLDINNYSSFLNFARCMLLKPVGSRSTRDPANGQKKYPVPRTQTILWQSCKAYKMTFESVFNFEVYCLLTEYKDRVMKY